MSAIGHHQYGVIAPNIAEQRVPTTGQSRARILIASELPGGAAGISVAAEVLLDALSRVAEVGVLYHAPRLRPTLRSENGRHYEVLRLGTQPVIVHAEGVLAGLIHRRTLGRWDGVWAVGSRYAGAALAARIPFVVWEATTISAELRLVTRREAKQTGLGSGWGAALHRALAPLNDRVEASTYRRAMLRLGMSEYSRRTMAERAGLPIDAVALLPAPPRNTFLDALARATRKSPGGVLRVMLVGRIADSRKNAALFVQAMQILVARGVPLHATIIGPVTAEVRDRLLAMAGAWLTLAGEVDMDTLAAAYRSSDLLVVSSRQEGYGFTVVEAMHAGLPVVSTRCGGPEAMIEESGAGVLISHDPESLASAVESLSRKPERLLEMSRAALDYANRVLSPETFRLQVEGITRQLVAYSCRLAT